MYSVQLCIVLSCMVTNCNVWHASGRLSHFPSPPATLGRSQVTWNLHQQYKHRCTKKCLFLLVSDMDFRGMRYHPVSSAAGFTFGTPRSTPSGRPDLVADVDMTNFGSGAVSGAGRRAGCPAFRRAFRKRHPPPDSGPARKRRADEASMVGELQNLSLNGAQARQQKCRFRRWQELENRMADQLADEEEQHGQQQQLQQPLQPRIVLSDELQKMVSSPVPDLIPDTIAGSRCTALVLWRPPVTATSPDQPCDPPGPTDSQLSGVGRPVPAPAASPAVAAGCWSGLLTAAAGPAHPVDSAPPASARCPEPLPPADDEAMDL